MSFIYWGMDFFLNQSLERNVSLQKKSSFIYRSTLQVTLLSLLVVPDRDSNYLKIWNFNQVRTTWINWTSEGSKFLQRLRELNSKWLLCLPFIAIIIAISCLQVIIALSTFNLMLPTLTLYSLSLSDFGRRMESVTKLTVAHQTLQLFLINVPFLGVRIYLW